MKRELGRRREICKKWIAAIKHHSIDPGIAFSLLKGSNDVLLKHFLYYVDCEPLNLN